MVISGRMGIPEALISTLGTLISTLSELVAAVSGDLRMVLKPAKVHRALCRSPNVNESPQHDPMESDHNRNTQRSDLETDETNIYKNPDIYLSVPDLIEKSGFPLEFHKVVTKDKYILTIFRIPCGRRGQRKEGAAPVLLMHGLLNSAGAWTMHDDDKALAYKLADEGFDCWIANSRGSTYSRTHEHLSESDKEFWDFSFHEMGLYDVPAIIDYVLDVCKCPQINYVGHSLGNNMLMIAMSHDPSINEKIKLFISFAPAVYLYKTTATMLKIHAPYCHKQKTLLEYLTGTGEFMPNTFLKNMKKFSFFAPNPEYLAAKCVTASMYTLGGYNPDQIHWPKLPVIASHTPSSTSVRTYIHCLQYFNSSEFQQYDYGSSELNKRAYGQTEPLKYDLTKVTAPVVIFYGANDMLCHPETVERLANELPNLVSSYRVECEKFSHTDFLYAKDADTLVYDKVIQLLHAS